MIDVLVPDEQEGTKAVVRAWLKQVGDAVAVNDPLVELETDKVTQEVPAPAAGVLAEIVLDTDAEAVPGALLGRIDAERCTGARPEPERSASSACSAARLGPGLRRDERRWETRLSPSVRRALPAARHRSRAHRRAPAAAGGSPARMSTARSTATRQRRRAATAQPRHSPHDIPHDRMRLKIAENMVRAVAEAPHVTAVFEADFSRGRGAQGGAGARRA